jgi:PIN domain
MKELHALVDYENVQPTLDELEKLAPGFTDVWLFHGPHQLHQAGQFAKNHARVTPVPRSGAGPNALDFHLSFYLGYVAAKHPHAHLVVVANDKGYDPMIAHAKTLGFTVKRQGHKVRPSPVAKAAPAKNGVAVKVNAPVKKASVKKVAPARVSASKTPTPKAPTKKAVAKKATSRQPPLKKVPAPKKATPVVSIQAAAPSMEAKAFTRIQKGLTKMGNKAPHNLMPFLRHVGALLGKGSTAEQIDAVVAKLEKAGVVRVSGDLVLYAGI